MAGRVDAVLVVTIDLAKGLCLQGARKSGSPRDIAPKYLDIMATTVLYASSERQRKGQMTLLSDANGTHVWRLHIVDSGGRV